MGSPRDYLRELVQQQAAWVVHSTSERAMEGRLKAITDSEGSPNLEALVQKLKSRPIGELHRRVVEALTVRETSFFRDLKSFSLLRTRLFPELFRLRCVSRRLNIWSAGCSTGQEAYSIAMLVMEYFPTAADWNIHITGSDLSAEAVERATAGDYSQLEVNRGLPPHLLRKFFSRRGLRWQVKGSIRQKVSFRQLNLKDSFDALPQFDLVLLRYVLMYFGPEDRRSILAKVKEKLRHPGFLLLSSSELTGSLDGFKTSLQGNSTYYSTLDNCGSRNLR